MKKLIYPFAVLLLGFIACNNQDKPADGVQERAVAPDIQTTDKGLSREDHIKEVKAESVETFGNVDSQAQSKVQELTGHYLKIKEAFIASDAQQAAQHAENMRKILNGWDGNKLPEEQKSFLESRKTAMDEKLQQIASSQDVLQQREHFARLSKHTTELVKAYGTGKGTLYYQYCPMAFDNKGAYWLSAEKEIKNPYYPKEMLGCGRVAESL